MADLDGTPTADGRTLILMRHAAAGAAARDHDRPLTPDGVLVATDAGRWIKVCLPPVDLTICSTATRTRQTFAAAGVGGDVRYSDELYGGGVDDILDQVATAPAGVRTLLVVGHAPTIPSTAWELVTQARLRSAQPEDPVDDSDQWRDDLRHFAAGTFAVLTTTGTWTELSDVGATLRQVRHPMR